MGTLKCEGTKTKDNACSDCHEPWRALLGNILDKWQGCMSIADAERREREDQLERYQREKAHMEEKSANPSPFDAFGDPDKGLDFEEDSMLTLLPRKERCSECSEEMKRDATQPKEKATLARVLDCETCGGRGFLFVPHETGPKVSKQLICSMSKYVKESPRVIIPSTVPSVARPSPPTRLTPINAPNVAMKAKAGRPR